MLFQLRSGQTHDRQPVSTGFQPFSPGDFLRNGEVFRNSLLDSDDPASQAPGTQLDYSVVRAVDRGAGLVASFRLRAMAPSGNSVIRIDEIGIRETRVFLPDGSQRAFRFITPLNAKVRGISIEGIPPTLVLARGRADTTVLRLNDYVFDPVHDIGDIQWQFPANTSLRLEHDTAGGSLTISAPEDAASWERLILTAINPDGQSAADTVDVFVNAAPTLDDDPAPVLLNEDDTVEVAIDVEDVDTNPDLLRLDALAPPELGVEISGPPFVAHISPETDWHGSATVYIVAIDNFDFSDTTAIRVDVSPVNDAPEILLEPNIRLTGGKRDSSLTLSGLIHDPDEEVEDLRLSWSGGDKVQIQLRDGRLVLGARDEEWMGDEQILLTVEDRDGLVDSALLTVSVVASVPPSLIDAPRSYGLASGDYFILGLNDLVVDPDDEETSLTWKVDGQDHLQVQFNNLGQARVEAPASFAGTETLRFTVIDPSGESAAFDILVFSAPSSGEPVVAVLPEVTVPVDGVDSSVDLDDYVFDADHGNDELIWSITTGEIPANVDPVTHVLTISPTGTTGIETTVLELRVVDPDSNTSVQSLTVHLTGSTAVSPDFTLAPMNDFGMRPGDTTVLNLDDFVRGDLDPSEVSWRVEGSIALDVEIDSTSRQATIKADDQWQENEFLTFVASHGTTSQRRTVTVSATGAVVDPPDRAELASFPQLVVQAGEFDQSLVLDDFVSGIEPSELTWEVIGDDHTQVVIDTDTRRLIILADAGWDGLETLTLIARHEDGTTLQGSLDVTVLPLTNELGVRALTQVTLFAGERSITLDLDELMPGHGDVSDLTWEAEAAQGLTTRYDPEADVIVFESPTPWLFSDIISLTVRDADGAEASGQVVVQVEANDGTAGETTGDFRVAIVPNVFQPDFLDIFVISDMPLDRQPLLRLQDEDWRDLPLTSSAPGIWFGDHTLGLGQEGQLQILALGIGLEDRLVKAEVELSLATVQPASGKRLTNDQVSLYLPRDSFGEEAVVAVFPGEMVESGPELIPLSQIYTIHSPKEYVGQRESRIGFETNAASRAELTGWGVYRWDQVREAWTFAGSEIEQGRVVAPIAELGRYALMADLTPPRLIDLEEYESTLALTWQDSGSGIDRFSVLYDGRPVPEYRFEDGRLLVERDDLPAAEGILSVQAFDRAGNRSARVEKRWTGTLQPTAFSLGQNFPNPFNPSTVIPFSLPVSAHVSLRVYNAAGQQVRQLLDESLAAGPHRIGWDATDETGTAVSSGLYIYRLEFGQHARVRKMTLMR